MLANSSTWLGELGPHSKEKAAGDDIIKSSNPDYRSSAANSSYSNTSTADTMYPKTENNPFYPAIQGTQKAYSNTDDQITGTQPYGYGEDDIFAGQFFLRLAIFGCPVAMILGFRPTHALHNNP